MALTKPFAENGNKLPIPTEASPDGSVSYDQGFGASYALPPEEGGKFIDRAQFNQLMYDTTSQVLANKTAIATKANANETVNLTGNQRINGTKTFNNNIVSPNITAMQNNLNTIFSSTTSPVKTQTTRKTITVGTGGNFANLSQALYEAKKYNSLVTIQLVSDLELSETLQIDSVNGKHILIDFNNYKITNSSATAISLIFTACAIGRIINLKLVNINFVVGINSQIALGGTGNIQSNQRINGGDKNANDALILITQGSLLNFTDSANYTLKNLNDSNVIYSGTGSIISLSSLTVITATTQTGNLFAVYNAGIIAIHSGTAINKPAGLNLYNVTVNTPSANGLILDKNNRV